MARAHDIVSSTQRVIELRAVLTLHFQSA